MRRQQPEGAENVESNLEAEKKKKEREGGEQSMPSMPAASSTNSPAFSEGSACAVLQSSPMIFCFVTRMIFCEVFSSKNN